MLHQLPPPESGPRHRTGYRHIGDEEETVISEETVENILHDNNEGAGDETEREIVEHEGWKDLIWSFTASALLTVSSSNATVPRSINRLLSVSSIFLSNLIRNSIVWKLPS